MPNILITGASRGLGQALALACAKQQAHVIALARTQSALTKLDDAIKNVSGNNATLVPFDLAATGDEMAQLGQKLFERFHKLDGLILNAAHMAAPAPIAHTHDKDWRQVFEVNVTANMRLLRVLEPMLRMAVNPKIIFVTCHNMGDAYCGAYAASKRALEQMARSYKEETQSAGFKTYVFDPGPMPTQLRRNAFPGEDQSTLPDPAHIADALLETLKNV